MKILFSILFLCILSILNFQGCRTMEYTRLKGSYKEYHIDQQGIDRLYFVHLPPQKFLSYPVPVLFCLHGGGGNARSMIGLTLERFNELSDIDGFIVVYPQGAEKGWNDGRKGDFSKAIVDDIDDIGYFISIIADLKKKFNVDASRIFACGISNGGFMSARLACELSGAISGVAIIAATIGVDYLPQCIPSKPLKVLIMNGTSDPLVPFNGGEIKIFRKSRGTIISSDEAFKFWSVQNKCSSLPSKDLLPDNDPEDGTRVEKYWYSACKDGSDVIFYKILNGGHTWPSGRQYLNEKLIGKTCKDINACDEIWNFFKK